MLVVQIHAGLIEKTLRSGNKIGSLLEVIEGLPYNAQLVDARMDTRLSILNLYFSQPTVPDTEVTELRVSFKSEAAISLNDLEATKKKAHLSTGVMVERTIG